MSWFLAINIYIYIDTLDKNVYIPYTYIDINILVLLDYSLNPIPN